MLKRKGLVMGVSIGVVCGLLTLPALQSAFADGSKEDLQNQKTQIEQQEEQLDVKEDKLEQDLAAGKITIEEFDKQDQALEKEDNKLDAKEEKIEKNIGDDDDDRYDDDRYDRDKDDDDDDDDQYKKPTGNKDQIAQAKRELAKIERLEEELDQREDRLENDFETGKISKAEFEKKMREIEAQEDKLDAQEEKWERVLGDDD